MEVVELRKILYSVLDLVLILFLIYISFYCMYVAFRAEGKEAILWMAAGLGAMANARLTARDIRKRER